MDPILLTPSCLCSKMKAVTLPLKGSSQPAPSGTQIPSVVVTIPAFNEAKRLPPFLGALLPLLNSLDAVAHIHVQIVDDGSRPEEKALCRAEIERRKSQYPNLCLTFLELPRNEGKGGAILHGWRAVPNADFYLFVDSDGAVPASEVARLLHLALQRKEPVSIFGSRIKMLGKSIERSALRHYSGRLFAFLVGTYINPDIYDSQCGLKILPGAHFRRVDKYLTGNRFAFDVELLAAATVHGLPIEEAPIDWHDVAGSKVSLVRDTLRMARSVASIHRLVHTGYYSR
jgi:dolichyl-phosphate beta-glucosyltransferase